MDCNQEALGPLARRIEQAYRRKNRDWRPTGLPLGIWESAAARLREVSRIATGLPIDPELFVASQSRSRTLPDPWAELTRPRSLRRYVKTLRSIVLQLRGEVREEIRRFEGRAVGGLGLDHLLSLEGSRISPLSRYIVAHRAGRADLALRFSEAARDQDRSCPLYRLACRPFLDDRSYPTMTGLDSHNEMISFSLN